MLSELEALLAGALEGVVAVLDVTNETHIPRLVDSLVALAAANEEQIEFFYACHGLTESPSLLKPLVQVNEWDWASSQVAALPAATVLYVGLEQTLHWALVLSTTDGECGRLRVSLTAATGTQISGAVSVVQAALRYHGLKVFVDSEEAWCHYLSTLQGH